MGRRLREDDGRRFPRERARPWRHAVVRQAPPAPGRSARAGSNRPTRLARAGDAGARWRDRIRHGRHQARRDADAAVRFTAGRGSLRRSEQSRPHRRSVSRRSLGPVPDSGAARQPESVRRARRRIRRALQHLGRRLGRRRLPGHQDDPELPAASRPGRRLRRGADGLRRDRRAGTAHARRAADAKRVVRRGRRGPVADCGAVDFAAGQAAGAVGPHPADGPFRSAAAAGRAVRGPRTRTCVQPHGEPPRRARRQGAGGPARGRGRQPRKRRFPRARLARAAHTVDGGTRLGADAAIGTAAARAGAARLRGDRAQRPGATPADRRSARCLAHRLQPAAPRPRAGAARQDRRRGARRRPAGGGGTQDSRSSRYSPNPASCSAMRGGSSRSCGT